MKLQSPPICLPMRTLIIGVPKEMFSFNDFLWGLGP